jgi:hypothetical protein
MGTKNVRDPQRDVGGRFGRLWADESTSDEEEGSGEEREECRLSFPLVSEERTGG